MFDFILSLFAPRRVDSILKSLHTLIARLEQSAAAFEAKAEGHANRAQAKRAETAVRVAQLYEERDRVVAKTTAAYRDLRDEASRAKAVASKFSELVQ